MTLKLKVRVKMNLDRGSRGVGRNTPYCGLSARLRPKGVPFFELQVYKRVGISQVEVYKRVGKSVIWVFEKAFNYDISNRCPL